VSISILTLIIGIYSYKKHSCRFVLYIFANGINKKKAIEGLLSEVQ